MGAVQEMLRQVASGMLELAWPTRCVVCDVPGQLLCADCAGELPFIAREGACPRCGAPDGLVACTECWSGDGQVPHDFSRAVCALEFDERSSRLVTCYKDQGERRLAGLLAQLQAEAVGEAAELDPTFAHDLATYVPATPEAVRRRGFDHMLPVAQRACELLGLPFAPLLGKADSADQRHLGKGDRAANMRDAFRVEGEWRAPMGEEGSPPAGKSLEGRRILLMDDVLTTGSTLDAAARVLLEAGAAQVDVATVLRVW